MSELNYFTSVKVSYIENVGGLNTEFDTAVIPLREISHFTMGKSAEIYTSWDNMDNVTIHTKSGHEYFVSNTTTEPDIVENFIEVYEKWEQTCLKLQEEGIINDVIKMDVKHHLETELNASIKKINDTVSKLVVAATTEGLDLVKKSSEEQGKVMQESIDGIASSLNETLQTFVQLNDNHSRAVSSIHKDLEETVLPSLKKVSEAGDTLYKISTSFDKMLDMDSGE